MGGHGFGGGGKWFRNEGKEIWFGVVVFDKTRKGKRNGESRSTRFSECAPLMSGCCTWNGQFHESVEMISSQHEIKNKIYYLANFIHFYSTFFPLHEYRPKMDIDDLLYDSLMYIYIFFSTRDFDQSELRRRYDKTLVFSSCPRSRNSIELVVSNNSKKFEIVEHGESTEGSVQFSLLRGRV